MGGYGRSGADLAMGERMATLARTIYLADDDPALRQGLGFALRSRGYDVRMAANGKELLDLLESGRPDLMLIDLMMPGMSGLEVVTRIRSDDRWSGLPVVLLTAAAGAELRGAEGGSGGLLVVSKPVRLSDLLREIDHQLSST